MLTEEGTRRTYARATEERTEKRKRVEEKCILRRRRKRAWR